MENCLLYDVIYDFSVWLRTGSNPADVDRFQSHTGREGFVTMTDLIFCLNFRIDRACSKSE